MPEYSNANQNIGMDWGDEIKNDGQEYVLLPEGDYNFVVTNFERGRFPGSAKISPCNKASLTLQVNSENGIANVRTDLILNRILEWRISAFFRSIGLKKKGERLTMDWSKVVGSMGRAHFKPRTYKDRDGNEHQINDVAHFYDYDEKYFPTKDGWTAVDGDEDDLPF